MPLPEISCPSCGETEHLRGRRETKGLVITCDACGARWERDVRRRCRLCGSEDLRYTPQPLWERGRGDWSRGRMGVQLMWWPQRDVGRAAGRIWRRLKPPTVP
jgi:hypothetical protein